MMNEDMGHPDVAEALANGQRTSAATIEHTEVHVDMQLPTTIKTADPEARYSTNEMGQPKIVVQTKHDPSEKPKDFVVTSCFVIMFCNFIWGIAGWHFGLKANYAWQLGDLGEARRQAKKAKIFVICGVITGIITYVLALTLFFTISPLRPGA